VLGFQGIFFSSGFNVIEAKDILNAEMEALGPKVSRIYQDLRKRRPAITTFSQKSVWDCFGSMDGFVNDLHFTFGINEDSHDIALTVPHSAKRAWSRLKAIFSDQGNEEELFLILKDLRKKVPCLFLQFHQRHFIYMKKGITDGYMEFDIDTLGNLSEEKTQKQKSFLCGCQP